MALGTFIAGRVSSTWDPPGAAAAADLGIMEQGYDLSWQLAGEPISESDAYGMMFLDLVYRGLSNVFLQCDSLEYKVGSLAAVTPFQTMTPTGVTFLGPGVIGRLMSDMAGILILTSTAGTPAVASPASGTFTFSHLAENFDVRLLMNSKLKKVPIRFRILPYLDSVIKFGTFA